MKKGEETSKRTPQIFNTLNSVSNKNPSGEVKGAFKRCTDPPQ
jgi:hypothetical protein